MIRFLLLTWTMAFGWGWWLFAPKSPTTSLVGGVVLAVLTVALFRFMARRSRRLSASHEYVNARLEYHSGFSKGRWSRAKPARGDDGGSEFTLGRGT